MFQRLLKTCDQASRRPRAGNRGRAGCHPGRIGRRRDSRARRPVRSPAPRARPGDRRPQHHFQHHRRPVVGARSPGPDRGLESGEGNAHEGAATEIRRLAVPFPSAGTPTAMARARKTMSISYSVELAPPKLRSGTFNKGSIGLVAMSVLGTPVDLEKVWWRLAETRCLPSGRR
jgi:hypothetical protein